MSKKHLSNSLRKYIRKEKARIRRQFLDVKEQEELINKLYDKSCTFRQNTKTRRKVQDKVLNKK